MRERLAFVKWPGRKKQAPGHTSQALDAPLGGAIADSGIEADDIHYCMNCSAPLNGAFCYKCGQHDRELRRPIWSLIMETLDAFIAFDSRVVRTMIPLVFMPGFLTRQYNEGKRARFVPPVRLYVISVIVFFLTLSIANIAIVKIEFFPAPDTSAPQEEMQGEEAGPDSTGTDNGQAGEGGSGLRSRVTRDDTVVSDVQIGDSRYDLSFSMFADADPSPGAIPPPAEELDEALADIARQRENVLQEDGDETGKAITVAVLGFVEKILVGLERVSDNPRALNQTLNIWLPRVMIVMLPIFAILMRGLYWARQHYLFNMLVFSLHFHAYIFIVMTLFVIAQVGIGPTASAWLFAAAVPLYLFVGMKVISRQGWFRTTFKFLVMSFIYGLLLSLTLTGTFIYGLSEL